MLGTLPQSAVAGVPQEGPQISQPNAYASADTRTQFDAAMNLLAKAQYDEARASFRTFADSYPRDDLAPQAIYLVTSEVGDYRASALNYLVDPACLKASKRALSRDPLAPAGYRTGLDVCANSRISLAISS